MKLIIKKLLTETVTYADYGPQSAGIYPELPYSAKLINPERGFYEQKSTNSSVPTPLDKACNFAYWREKTGLSIIRRIVYLDIFMNDDISPDFLQLLKTDFERMRAVG